MAALYPDARLTANGEVVGFIDGAPLPSYTGPVYAELVNRPYILWLYPAEEDGTRRWGVINAGSVIMQLALDTFINQTI